MMQLLFYFTLIFFTNNANFVINYDVDCSAEENINFVHSHVSFNYSLQDESMKKNCNIKFTTDPTNFLFFSFEKLSNYGKMPSCSRKYFEFGTQCDCNDEKYNCKTKIKLCGGEQFLVNPSILTHQCAYIKVINISDYVPFGENKTLLYHKKDKLTAKNKVHSINSFKKMDYNPTSGLALNSHLNFHDKTHTNKKELVTNKKNGSIINFQKKDPESNLAPFERFKLWLKTTVLYMGSHETSNEKESQTNNKLSKKRLRIISSNDKDQNKNQKHVAYSLNDASHGKEVVKLSTSLAKHELGYKSQNNARFLHFVKKKDLEKSANLEEENQDSHLYFEAKILKLTLNDVLTLFSNNNNDKAREYQYSQFLTFNVVENEYIVSKRFSHDSTNLQYLFYISISPTEISKRCDDNLTLSELDEELKVTFLLGYNSPNSSNQKQLCGFNDKGYRIVEATNFDMIVSTPSSSSEFIKNFKSDNLIDSQLIIGYIPYKTNIRGYGTDQLLTNWQIGLILISVFIVIVLSCIAFVKFRARRVTRQVEQADLELQHNLEDI